jgi:DNA-binding MarR family transcriptional regulator
MSMQDVYSKPGHLIRRVQQIAVATFMAECAEHDVTPVQYAALVAIRENPGLDATRIAALVAFDRSTLGNVLERLESKGMIARSASASDRRVKILHLSTQGAQLLQALEPSVASAQKKIVAALNPDQQRSLLQLLEKIVAAADAEVVG